MTVNRYLFQSPYSSQVQVGRLDPSVKQESDAQKASTELSKNSNETLQKAQNFQASQVSEVKPKVEAAADSSKLLDVYA
jgi:hypothetical protein